MAYPGELIRRAQENKRQVRPPARQDVRPAEEDRNPPATGAWQTRHDSYTRLMRSHDRVHTRHLGG